MFLFDVHIMTVRRLRQTLRTPLPTCGGWLPGTAVTGELDIY